MKKLFYIFALFSLSIFVYSCATIMHGTKQDIGISSNPGGAKITVDGQMKGITPSTFKLSRKINHVIKIELKGYEPYSATLTREVSGWVWGNLVIGGIIGLGIDYLTGGLYDLTPEQIHAQLNKKHSQALFKNNSDNLFVIVTLNPKPEWKKIGQLKKLN